MTSIDPLKRPWREWYQLEVWRRRRRLQLRHFALRAMCLARGITTPATIADHIESHGGDWNAFRLGALQSLCKPCHDRGKRLLDLDGCSQDIDEDGWPIDGRHRANASRTPQKPPGAVGAPQTERTESAILASVAHQEGRERKRLLCWSQDVARCLRRSGRSPTNYMKLRYPKCAASQISSRQLRR